MLIALIIAGFFVVAAMDIAAMALSNSKGDSALERPDLVQLREEG